MESGPRLAGDKIAWRLVDLSYRPFLHAELRYSLVRVFVMHCKLSELCRVMSDIERLDAQRHGTSASPRRGPLRPVTKLKPHRRPSTAS